MFYINIPNIKPNHIFYLKNKISIKLFNDTNDYEIRKQFKEADEYKSANFLFNENKQSITHPQAFYTSRLLNPYTECLDCAIDD